MQASIVEMRVVGLAELTKAMRELPVEVHASALRPAVSAAAGVVQKDARLRAPRDTGTLAKAIYRTRSRSLSSGTMETAIVGVRFGKRYRKRGQDAWYWKFIEFGTSKMAARPFLRPAFESTKKKQLDAMVLSLKKGIARAAEKLRRKG